MFTMLAVMSRHKPTACWELWAAACRPERQSSSSCCGSDSEAEMGRKRGGGPKGWLQIKAAAAAVLSLFLLTR